MGVRLAAPKTMEPAKTAAQRGSESAAEESFAQHEAVPEEEVPESGENGAQSFLDSADEHPAPRISFLA